MFFLTLWVTRLFYLHVWRMNICARDGSNHIHRRLQPARQCNILQDGYQVRARFLSTATERDSSECGSHMHLLSVTLLLLITWGKSRRAVVDSKFNFIFPNAIQHIGVKKKTIYTIQNYNLLCMAGYTEFNSSCDDSRSRYILQSVIYKRHAV